MRLRTPIVAAFALLCACGEPFLNPPVLCRPRTYVFSLTTTPNRAGQPCDLGLYPFSVAYAPSVDLLKDPDARAYMFARGSVTLTAANGSVLLCEGSGQSVCMGGVAELQTRISDNGVVSYQGIFVTEGTALYPGGMAKSGGPLVYENYGPGNGCTVDYTAEFSCQEPVM